MNKLEHLEHVLQNLRSPKRSHTFWGMLGTVLVVFLMLWARHSDWLAQPNDHFLSISPDGYKNYFTTVWHVTRDSTSTHYGGMNYPFGEHTLFTDNQPIFANFMQWWHRSVASLDGRVVGWMNVFQIISMLLGGAFIFLLLRRLHLPVWYSALVTLGMVFLSPQNLRFDGHFGLSHTFVIPGLLYFLSWYEDRESRRYHSLILGIWVFVAAQLHFYYFGLAALFLSLYIGYQLLREWNWRSGRKRIFHWVVMIALPFAALNMWLHWSDWSNDRPASPYGFTSYIGFWEGIFLPYQDFPMYHWIEEKIIPIRKIDTEAQAYAGFVAAAFFLGMFGWAVIRRVRRFFVEEKIEEKTPLRLFRIFPEDWKKMAHHRSNLDFMRGIFTATFFLSLFACGFPFAIKGMEWMVDLMGPLRQFRGLGRFNWMFFYVVNLLAFYMIWHHSRFFPMRWRRWFFFVACIFGFYLIWNFLHHGPRRWEQMFFMLAEAAVIYGGLWWLSRRFRWFEGWAGSRKLQFFQTAIVLLPLAMLLFEAFTLQKLRKPNPSPNLTNRAIFDRETPENWLKKVDFKQFQAVLPLPYYHMGSENIWWEVDFEQFIQTQLTALHTGLPDMGVNMSRTSVGQTVESVQFVKEPGEQPVLLNEMPDNRPILILILNRNWEKMQADYPHLIKSSEPIFQNEKLRLLRLNLSTLRQIVRDHAREVKADMDHYPKLFPANGWLTPQEGAKFVYHSYDSLTTTRHWFQGGGAFEGRMCDTTWLVRDGNLPKGYYYVSFWTKATEDMGMNHECKIIQNARTEKREINVKHEGMRFHVKMIVNGWALFDLPFEVFEDGSRTDIFLKKDNAQNQFFLDEVVVKKTDITVFRNDPGWVARHNFWFKN